MVWMCPSSCNEQQAKCNDPEYAYCVKCYEKYGHVPESQNPKPGFCSCGKAFAKTKVTKDMVDWEAAYLASLCLSQEMQDAVVGFACAECFEKHAADDVVWMCPDSRQKFDLDSEKVYASKNQRRCMHSNSNESRCRKCYDAETKTK